MTQTKILVVDDEPLIRLDLSYMVEDLGHIAIEASNAAEALQLLEANPDIVAIVTDIDMPGTMDGRALAGAVHDRWPPCKLIVISGHHRLTTGDLPPGASFISKPVPARTLAYTLGQMGL